MKKLKMLDENISLPLKVIIPVVSAIIAGVMWLDHSLAELKIRQFNSWTVTEHSAFTSLWNERNTNQPMPSLSEVRARVILERRDNE
jgi:hypothetical protein